MEIRINVTFVRVSITEVGVASLLHMAQRGETQVKDAVKTQ